MRLICTPKFIFRAALLTLLWLSVAPAARADPVYFSNVQVAVFQPRFGSLDRIAPPVDLLANPNILVPAPGPASPSTPFHVGFFIDLTGGPAAPGTLMTITFVQTGGNSLLPPPYIVDLTRFNPPGNIATFPVHGLILVNQFTGGHYDYDPAVNAFEGFVHIDISGVDPDFFIPSGPNAGQGVNGFSFPVTIQRPIPAPEPATLLLLATGLAGVGAAARKRLKD